MQVLSNLFFRPAEAPALEQKMNWVQVAANGSAGLITSVALFALSVAATYSTALMLSVITGIVLPGATLFLLYPSTLLATYGVDRFAKPFFEKAMGITPEETDIEKSAEKSYKKAAGCLALGVITSLALWSLATLGAVFAMGFAMRFALGPQPGLNFGRLFQILIMAPLAGSFFSIPAIHQISAPHFQRAKEFAEVS